jgi:hypothetical protein
MMMLFGAPGSGKSTFFREYLCESHHRINNDTIKNPGKALKLCDQLLSSGESVVVDNLNASAKARSEYLKLAEKNKVKQIKCLVFETKKEQCLANNDLRKMFGEKSQGGYLHMSKNISKVVIHSFFKNHEPPTKEEGFTEIKNLPYLQYRTQNTEKLQKLQDIVDIKSVK